METLITKKVSIVLCRNFEIMEVKERILIKAHELFNRYGIRSVSMDDLAGHLGVSKKTLYQYYTDKEELVDAIFCTIMEGNRSSCTQNKKVAENAVHELFLAFDMIQEMFSNLRLAITRIGTLPFAPHAPETPPVRAPPRHRMRKTQGTDRSPRRLRRADRSERYVRPGPERDLYADLRAAWVS